ncbi:hypothetical protein VIBNISO65_830013 [Vibrio nigripulchritudo SO65]|nr:hypothetical protein VIBNIFTn2_360013 [Vibrio nigripulchritudo FTn2]CCN79075.1 hypothetical protein VIBNISO65_830013 [Vibrio nigripulchritudo SO65]
MIMSYFFTAYNAKLRGKQHYHPDLKHCAINTNLEVEAKANFFCPPELAC